MILSPHEIAFIALEAGFTEDEEVSTVVAIALAESGGDTEALGRSKTGASVGNRDHGLMQISGRWHGDKLQRTPDWRNPWVNMDLAFLIYEEAGRVFTPWHVFTSGSYKIYLPDGEIAAKWPFPVSLHHDLKEEIQEVELAVRGIRRHFA